MKKNRRRARQRAAKASSELVPVEAAFTQAEEAFFEAGASLSDLAPVESFADLDHGHKRRGLLSRLFSRN